LGPFSYKAKLPELIKMKQPTLSRYILIVFFTLLTIGVFAEQKSKAELISYHSTVTINNKKLTRKHSYELRINNHDGEIYTTVSIPFSSMIKISNLNASIKTVEGLVIKKLNKKDIKERNSFPSFSFYEDQFVKEFTLTHNIYPYVLSIEYEEKEDQFIHVDDWYPIMDIEIPTTNATLTIQAPKDYKINFYSQFATEIPKDSVEDNYIYKWSASYDGNVQAEKFSPPLRNFLPMVVAVPETFTYDIDGSLTSWQSFGFWQHELIQNTTDLPDYERQKINEVIKGAESKDEIIKKLFHYLQDETRYINISIETGGLKPYPARYVAQNRYGDCKALSNYFRAVLKSVDIESYYSKIYAGEVIHEIHHEVPSQQSNHIILCVPDDNDTIWVDCTSDDPFRYTGTFIQNREVFVINNNHSFFTKTPSLQPDQVLKEREVSLTNLINNETAADFKTVYRGSEYEYFNQVEHLLNDDTKEKLLRENVIDNSFNPISIRLNNLSRDSAKAVLEYSARSSEIYKQYGNDLLIKLLSFYTPKMEQVQDRKLPLQINYPIYQKDKLDYKIPEGFKIDGALPNHLIESKYGKYEISSELSEHGVLISKSFLLFEGNYPLEEYEAFYAFIASVAQIENKTYITTSKEN